MIKSKKKMLFNTLAFLLSIALLIFLIKNVSLKDVKEKIKLLSAFEILVISSLYILTSTIRGMRLGAALEKSDILSSTLISVIHSFLNHVLPFRLGEVTLPILFKRFKNRSIISSTSALILLRLYDLLSLALLFSLSLAMYALKNDVQNVGVYLSISSALTVFFALFILYLPKALKLFSELSSKALEIVNTSFTHKLSNIITEKTEESLSFFSSKNILQKAILYPFLSVTLWLSMFLMFYFTMLFLEVDLSFIANVIASSAAILTNLLPINGLGSLGTLEAGWTFGYTRFGIETSVAIASGFIMHAVVILTGFIMSALSFLYLSLKKRKELKN